MIGNVPEDDYPTIQEIQDRMNKGIVITEEWITNLAKEKEEKENLINTYRKRIFR